MLPCGVNFYGPKPFSTLREIMDISAPHRGATKSAAGAVLGMVVIACVLRTDALSPLAHFIAEDPAPCPAGPLLRIDKSRRQNWPEIRVAMHARCRRFSSAIAWPQRVGRHVYQYAYGKENPWRRGCQVGSVKARSTRTSVKRMPGDARRWEGIRRGAMPV